MKYTPGDMKRNGFVDSDYAADTMDRKSLSGYIIKIGGASCIWGSKDQATVALSTCEAEYHAIIPASKELIGICRILKEVGVDIDYVPELLSDNQPAINWSISEQCPSTRANHIDVKVHFVREKTRKKKLKVSYVSSTDNDADILTKPLPHMQHQIVCSRICLSAPTEEEC